VFFEFFHFVFDFQILGEISELLKNKCLRLATVDKWLGIGKENLLEEPCILSHVFTLENLGHWFLFLFLYFREEIFE
jgi:hypothetical protein